MASTYIKGQERNMNTTLSPIEAFQQDLEKVKEKLAHLLKSYGIKNGITIEVKDGKIRTFIDNEKFR